MEKTFQKVFDKHVSKSVPLRERHDIITELNAFFLNEKIYLL